jgi:hypothetical protein
VKVCTEKERFLQHSSWDIYTCVNRER